MEFCFLYQCPLPCSKCEMELGSIFSGDYPFDNNPSLTLNMRWRGFFFSGDNPLPHSKHEMELDSVFSGNNPFPCSKCKMEWGSLSLATPPLVTTPFPCSKCKMEGVFFLW